MSIEARKAEELSQKAAAFGAGVDHWLKERRAQEEFRIHSSQLKAIDALLTGVRTALTQQIKGAVEKGSVLARTMSIENMILAGYQIWEFYRAKMAQRLESHFNPFLRIADEFAWQCYRPVRDAVFGTRPDAKEPPLVYLNAEWSPFLKERNRRYQVEGVPDVFLSRQRDFQSAVAQLPFPVIGVPWYQAGFLPGGLTIAHEVGHAVIADCGFRDELVNAMAGVSSPARRKQWEAWGEEMFADAYGCLAAGPAFAFSLADTLAADRATVDVSPESQYPPHSLRIQLNCAMLSKTRHDERAAELWKQWSHQYPAPYPWDSYKDDVETVAEALLNIPVPLAKGGFRPLQKLLSFSAALVSAAETYAEETRKNHSISQPGIPVRWAAARIAYDSDPVGFADKTKYAPDPDLASRFTDRMRRACPDDLRGGEKPVGPNRLQYLEKLGEQLLTQA